MNTYRESLSTGDTISLPSLDEKRLNLRNGRAVLQAVGRGEEEAFVVGKITIDGGEHEIPQGAEVLGVTQSRGAINPQAWLLIPQSRYE